MLGRKLCERFGWLGGTANVPASYAVGDLQKLTTRASLGLPFNSSVQIVTLALKTRGFYREPLLHVEAFARDYQAMANSNPKTDHLVPTQFKPGHVPSPESGPKRKRPMSEANDDLLRQEIPEEMLLGLNTAVIGGVRKNMKILKKGATWADAIAYGLVKQALLGQVPAAKELRESVEGKATQRIELISQEDKQIELSVIFESAIGKNVERVIESRAEAKSSPISDAAKKLIAAAQNDDAEDE